MDSTPHTPDSGTPSDHNTIPPSIPMPTPDHDVETNKDLAAFSYIYVMSVIIYLLKRKESPFIRFHSKQAMVLFLVAVIVWFIPVVGHLLEIVVLAGIVMGFFHAAQGQRKDVPLAGPLSRGEMTVREAGREIVQFVVMLGKAIRDAFAGREHSAPPQNSTPSTEE